MVLLIANKTFFLHVHILNNGTIIEHAHPYNKSHDSNPHKSHQHSNAEYIFFQNLEILFSIVFLTIALMAFVKKERFPFLLHTRHALICIDLKKGRAPPIS